MPNQPTEVKPTSSTSQPEEKGFNAASCIENRDMDMLKKNIIQGINEAFQLQEKFVNNLVDEDGNPTEDEPITNQSLMKLQGKILRGIAETFGTLMNIEDEPLVENCPQVEKADPHEPETKPTKKIPHPFVNDPRLKPHLTVQDLEKAVGAWISESRCSMTMRIINPM